MPVRWILLRPLSLSLVLLVLAVSPSKSDQQQVENLLKFKSALDKSETGVFATWTRRNSACNFTGIVCDSGGSVVEINLGQRNLSNDEGEDLPFDSICAIGSLERLVLGNNSLRGRIGGGLRNCTRLRYLDLGSNSFSGHVPGLDSLQELEFLSLNRSGVSGKFPWSSLKNLTRLSFLSVGDNPFDPSPFPEEVLNLSRLYCLYLTNCSITGKIPEGIQNLVLLENLELADNDIIGEIPKGIVKLGKLWQLELYNNSLSSKLPVGFGNLTNLENFDASDNMLEGDLSELRFLKKLRSLHLFENRLTGEIPVEFGDFRNLVGFSLYRNNITGKLPEKIGSWNDFNYIDVSENFLEGPIPRDMCKNGQMTRLLLLQNRFSGEIPESYSNCKTLIRFRVSNNSLSGVVPPGIWGLPNLLVLDLAMNRLEGPVTDDIGNAISLSLLDLKYNQFSGVLPSLIVGASSLVSINLDGNKFSGQIPASFGKLKKLLSLYMSGNDLSGVIPDSLGSCVSLVDINLAGNSLSGQIPASLGFMPSLNSLNLSRNKLSGQIPGSLSSLKLSLLDLSNNELVGPVPESLSSGSFEGNPGLCSSAVAHLQPCPSEKSFVKKHLSKFYICFIAAMMLTLIVLACYLSVRLGSSDRKSQRNKWSMKSFRILSFTEKEIIDAIKTENLIGKGGHGNVYKVTLKNGEKLAVKHIWQPESCCDSFRSSTAILSQGCQQNLHEYEAEVAALSNIRHVNVVKLYCSITSEDSNLLVYEYLPNGSLWERLHMCRDEIEMSCWGVRYAIAVGAARGLEYLHHGCDRPVIHRDVKSSNILLDEEWRPRIADFGLAKIVQAGGGRTDLTHVVAGTLGYFAPEYAYTFNISEKSDVYSFGVVLMELATGRMPVEPEFGENKDIVMWVSSKMRDKESLMSIIDSVIPDESKEDALKVLKIALLCTAKYPSVRPSMRLVVQMLEEAEPSNSSSNIDVNINNDDDEEHNSNDDNGSKSLKEVVLQK